MTAGGGRGSRALAAGLILVLLGGMMVLRRQSRRLRRQIPGSAAALSKVLTAGERMAASLLGGFRPLLINILWVRIQLHVEKGRFLELPFLYEALEELQGTTPALFRVEARNMMLDFPRVLADRPEERWQWIRRGMVILGRGRERFPQDPEMFADSGILYYLRFHPRRSATDRARFLADREANPGGADPLSEARRFLEEALRFPGHALTADVYLFNVIWFEFRSRFEEEPPPRLKTPGAGEAARRDLVRLEEIYRHIAANHTLAGEGGGSGLLKALRGQIAEAEDALRQAQAGARGAKLGD